MNVYSIVVAGQKRERRTLGDGPPGAGDGLGKRSCAGCGYPLRGVSFWASSVRERTPSLR